jgi:hypothetical protein
VAADPPGGAATAVDAQPTSQPGTTAPPPVDATAPPPHRGEQLDCSAAPDCGAPTPALFSVVAPPRDPNDVIAQVLNYSTTRLQQTDPADGAGQYARESAASNFRSREWEQGMLDLVVTYWVWIISALIASGLAGYWSTRPQVARGRGVQGWQGWAALAFAIGLVVAILLPGLYLDALLFLSSWCIIGFPAGAWLRHARTRTQVAAAHSAEEARRAAEVKATEEARRAAEVAVEDARRTAEVKAAGEAHRAAEAKAVQDARRAAEAKAAEDARRAAEMKAAEGARGVAKAKATKRARRVAKAKAVEVGRRVAEAKAAEDAPRAAEAKVAEGARRAAEVSGHRARD